MAEIKDWELSDDYFQAEDSAKELKLEDFMSRRHPYNGWLGTLAVSPCYQTASQGALDFLFVQVTIALDALLMPLKGRSYYFDSVPLKGSSYSFTLNLSCMIS